MAALDNYNYVSNIDTILSLGYKIQNVALTFL